MRITTGSLGGRMVVPPKTTTTRPMADKVRGALFNVVGDVGGMIVLDAYAGSGAIGFEALSRGAERVVAIESGRAAAQALMTNRETLGVGHEYQLANTTVETWIKRNAAASSGFDLVVADPPYDQLQPAVLEKLGSLLEQEGILVVSHSSRLDLPPLVHLDHIDTRNYGDTALSFYKPT